MKIIRFFEGRDYLLFLLESISASECPGWDFYLFAEWKKDNSLLCFYLVTNKRIKLILHICI